MVLSLGKPKNLGTTEHKHKTDTRNAVSVIYQQLFSQTRNPLPLHHLPPYFYKTLNKAA